MTTPPSARCWTEIDLGALERNLKRIRAGLPEWIRYVAVVKADAYGHGMAQTVTRLMRSGVDLLAVANVREGIEIREIGAGWPILILSAALPDEVDDIVEWDLIPTLSSVEEAARFAAAARRQQRTVSVHLKIDTGMGRLGVWHENAEDLLAAVLVHPELLPAGIFTHFASADIDPAFTARQRRVFLNTLGRLKGLEAADLLIHADNSAGLESFTRAGPFNAVRVGLLQFGIPPSPDSVLRSVQTDPVLSFHTRVGLVKSLPAGTGISYGQTYTLGCDSRVAILAAGYADGIPTALSNRGSVLIRGNRCSVLGRVTMDQTIVDVTAIPHVHAGDTATFIGDQERESIRVEDFCSISGQIPWEALVSITKRVQRIYKIDTGI